jgi:hypothetical protein
LIDAALGNKQAALEEGRRATELLPVSKDAINGPIVSAYFAMIAAWAGEKDLAILPSERTWRLFRRSSARTAARSRLSRSYYKRHMIAGFTQHQSRRRFSGSIRSGTRCAAIPISKNSARKSSRKPVQKIRKQRKRDSLTEGNEDNESFEIGWNRIFVSFVAFCKNLLSLKRDFVAFVFFCLICSRQNHSRNPVLKDRLMENANGLSGTAKGDTGVRGELDLIMAAQKSAPAT